MYIGIQIRWVRRRRREGRKRIFKSGIIVKLEPQRYIKEYKIESLKKDCENFLGSTIYLLVYIRQRAQLIMILRIYVIIFTLRGYKSFDVPKFWFSKFCDVAEWPLIAAVSTELTPPVVLDLLSGRQIGSRKRMYSTMEGKASPSMTPLRLRIGQTVPRVSKSENTKTKNPTRRKYFKRSQLRE